jgi:hypothetical protein
MGVRELIKDRSVDIGIYGSNLSIGINLYLRYFRVHLFMLL